MLRHGAARVLPAALVLLATGAAVLLPAAPAAADQVRDQELWVLDALHVPAAWQVTQGKGVTVAVIDSGVDPAVSDLAGSVIPGRDFTGVHTPQSNPDWGVHGTWMATLIAGHGHGPSRSSGIIGVAPMARILSVRVVTDTGDPGYRKYQGEPDAVVQGALARAIRYAAVRGARVISMSLGYGAPSLPVREALQFALSHGIVVVASAGNSGNRATARNHRQAPYSFPADYPGVLGVGAVARDGSTAVFSSANLSVQVAAPGVMVPTQGRDGKYWYVNGTSPACALTAGVAALIKSAYPGLSPSFVDQAITSSAQGRPRGGYDDQVGFGTVDAAAALAMAHKLAHGPARPQGISPAFHFGGGPAAVPPPPVRPRSGLPLAIDAVLAMLCLAGAVLAGRRLTRPLPGHAAGPGQGRLAQAGALPVANVGWSMDGGHPGGLADGWPARSAPPPGLAGGWSMDGGHPGGLAGGWASHGAGWGPGADWEQGASREQVSQQGAPGRYRGERPPWPGSGTGAAGPPDAGEARAQPPPSPGGPPSPAGAGPGGGQAWTEPDASTWPGWTLPLPGQGPPWPPQPGSP